MADMPPAGEMRYVWIACGVAPFGRRDILAAVFV
jgi:hypothetical protein